MSTQESGLDKLHILWRDDKNVQPSPYEGIRSFAWTETKNKKRPKNSYLCKKTANHLGGNIFKFRKIQKEKHRKKVFFFPKTVCSYLIMGKHMN